MFKAFTLILTLCMVMPAAAARLDVLSNTRLMLGPSSVDRTLVQRLSLDQGLAVQLGFDWGSHWQTKLMVDASFDSGETWWASYGFALGTTVSNEKQVFDYFISASYDNMAPNIYYQTVDVETNGFGLGFGSRGYFNRTAFAELQFKVVRMNSNNLPSIQVGFGIDLLQLDQTNNQRNTPPVVTTSNQ